jgi:DNA ligase-1
MDNHRILYKNHHGVIGTWEGWTVGSTLFSRSRKVIGGKAVQHQADIVGKNIGRSNERTPEEQAVLELDSKTRLKIDKGYVVTEADAQAPATNGMGLPKPMLATPIEKVKAAKIDWATAYVQPKLDGHRALYKDGILYSRQGKPLNLPHINKAIEKAGLSHLHLDGELYVHGMALQHVSRLIKKYTDNSLQVKYHIYDIVSEDAFFERSCQYWQAAKSNPYIELVDTAAVSSMEEVLAYHKDFRDLGYEGTMLRFSNDPYGTDKRSRTLLKIKEFHDAEFPVVGWVAGKPAIRGSQVWNVPVWTCETAEGKTFNVTAAGDQAAKDGQYQHAEKYIGKQLTVKYHYLSSDGIPQLPIALRWREDV